MLFLSFTNLVTTLSVHANAQKQNHKMIGVLCLFLTAIQNVNAQSALPATNVLPIPPANVVPSAPAPLGNAALWQQALTLDATMNSTGNHANQYFYSSVAWWQSLENSSNSYLSGAPHSVDAGPYMSQLLQVMQNYPTRFDQAQASEARQNSSKQAQDKIWNVKV